MWIKCFSWSPSTHLVSNLLDFWGSRSGRCQASGHHPGELLLCWAGCWEEMIWHAGRLRILKVSTSSSYVMYNHHRIWGNGEVSVASGKSCRIPERKCWVESEGWGGGHDQRGVPRTQEWWTWLLPALSVPRRSSCCVRRGRTCRTWVFKYIKPRKLF